MNRYKFMYIDCGAVALVQESYSSFISIRIFSCQVEACLDYLNSLLLYKWHKLPIIIGFLNNLIITIQTFIFNCTFVLKFYFRMQQESCVHTFAV